MLLPLKAIISKKPRKDGKSPIYFQYCYSSTNRVLLSTEIAIPSNCWTVRRQCISKSLPQDIGDYETLNLELSRIRKLIESIIENGVANGDSNIGMYVKNVFSPNLKIETLDNAPVISEHRNKSRDFFAELDSYSKSKEKKVCEKGLANFRVLRDRMLAF